MPSAHTAAQAGGEGFGALNEGGHAGLDGGCISESNEEKYPDVEIVQNHGTDVSGTVGDEFILVGNYDLSIQRSWRVDE